MCRADGLVAGAQQLVLLKLLGPASAIIFSYDNSLLIHGDGTEPGTIPRLDTPAAVVCNFCSSVRPGVGPARVCRSLPAFLSNF